MTTLQRSTLYILVVLFIVITVVIIGPLWAPVVLASWFADLLSPLTRRLQRLLGGRRRGGAAIVVLLVAVLMVPLVGLGMSLSASVADLIEQVRAALRGQESLSRVFMGRAGANFATSSPPTLREWADMASRYGANAWSAVSLVVRTSASAVLGIGVFLFALLTFVAEGMPAYLWLARHSPVPPNVFTRLARAFRETGRGLIVGSGGTALIQGTIATVAYLALGVPRALVMGLLTAVCTVIPFFGSALVWIPISVELVIDRSYLRAVMVVLVGSVLHSLVDTFVRPTITRYGRLALPTVVVLISILGGIATFGAVGAFLGPLLVRLAVEVLAIARTARLFPRRSAHEGMLPAAKSTCGSGEVSSLPL